MLFAIASAALVACGGAELPPPQEPVATTEPPPASPPPKEPASPAASKANDTEAQPPSPPKPADGPADPEPTAPKPTVTQLDEAKPDHAPPADSRPDPKPGAVEAATAARVAAPIEGTLVSKAGAVLTIDLGGAAAAPSAGSKGSLYRHFEQDFGGFKTSGWLGVAEVTVKEVKAGKIRLTVDAEKSTIMVNGKKVNHFASGTRVKLELAR